ncbi:MAG: sigma-54-dependent transcriptional regulator [Phycisphaeraceae bacterium]
MTEPTRILIVDDDPIVAESLSDFLRDEGYATATAGDGTEALAMLEEAATSRSGPFGIVILDLNMPRSNGMELLRQLRQHHPSVAPIVLTGFGKIESAVEAIKLGAVDYLTKPAVDDELRLAVNKAQNRHTLVAENETLKTQLTERYGMGNLVGGDYRIQKVYDRIEAVAPTKTTVLITGESGTGKSMVARAIHALSNRASGPFVNFSCGAIPETLLESELFGHVKGAFTGADYDKPGKCLAANGGTLFIDEINSATPALQLKLLRVLQEKAFEPIGSHETMEVDVRFVLATNQSLEELVERGAFREDLYYRINVVNVHMPPLRERVGDIPLLAEHFLATYCQEMGRERRFSEESLMALRGYHWPGNVRELENVVERAVVLSKGPAIDAADLPEQIAAKVQRGAASAGGAAHASGNGSAAPAIPALINGWTPMPLDEALREPERQILLAALEANDWNRQETARQLEINRTTLYKKIKLHKLDEPQ